MTQSVAAPQLITGGTAPPGFEKDCEKLKERNEGERERTIGAIEQRKEVQGGKLSDELQTTLDKAKGTGMTFSSALSSIPGASGTFCASSSGVAQECNPSGLTSGGTSEQKVGCNAETRASTDPKHNAAKEKAGVLCNKSHVHPGGGKGAHAEPKIFNDLTNKAGAAAMRGGTVLLNIDWRFKHPSGTPDRSGMPCPTCYKMLCNAAKDCDIVILLCDEKNEPTPISKDDCAKDGSYEALSTRIDGAAKPGRTAAKQAAERAAKAF
jgi:hypothetical protein